MKYTKIKRKLVIKKFLIEFIGIAFGCLIMAISTSIFLLPNQLSTGGFAGIATIIYYILNIPLGITILILNIPLLILGFFRIGKDFLIKSIAGTVMLSVFLDLFDGVQIFTNDKLLASIYGGILTGIGTAIILKAGGSTGGSDLLSFIIKSYKKHFQTSNLIVIIDITIVVINVLAFKDFEVGLYSAIAIFLMGKMIDIIFEGVTFTKVMFIISPKYNEIADKISKKVNRGSTGIYAKGMFKQEEKMMLFCVGSRSEVIKIKEIATQIDKKAFIVISNARETWGKGFKRG